MCICPKCEQFNPKSEFSLVEHLWFAHLMDPFEAMKIAKKAFTRKHTKKVV